MKKTKQQAAVFMKSPNAMKAACGFFGAVKRRGMR